MTDQPQPGLAAALAELQGKLSTVTKTKTGKVKGTFKAGPQQGEKYEYEYRYADLADVSAMVLPLMSQVGLSFTCQPTLRDDGKFGLAYQLLHSSGELIDGWYPLDASLPVQQIGGHITYARRYCLCAVTGVAAEEDTDAQGIETGQRKTRERPPQRAAGNLPRNRDGSTSRSRVTDEELDATGQMTDAQLREHNRLQREVQGTGPQGTERLDKVPDDDPFYDTPALPVPQPAPPKAAVIHMHFKRLAHPQDGPLTDDQRYAAMSTITGRRIGSTLDLTAAEGIEVGRFLGSCRDHEALIERLAAKASETT